MLTKSLDFNSMGRELTTQVSQYSGPDPAHPPRTTQFGLPYAQMHLVAIFLFVLCGFVAVDSAMSPGDLGCSRGVWCR